MVLPEPALAPVMPPLIDPTVQVKLLATDAVRLIFVIVALQLVVVLTVVTTSAGLTVTIIEYTGPAQLPDIDVGVTLYSTVPVELSLELVNV